MQASYSSEISEEHSIAHIDIFRYVKQCKVKREILCYLIGEFEGNSIIAPNRIIAGCEIVFLSEFQIL